jgi:hypothetical protein
MNGRDTMKMVPVTETKKTSKAEIIKAWGAIITAVLAFAGTVVVTILNSDDVEQYQINNVEVQVEKHFNKSFADIVEHINSQSERIVKLETMIDIYKEEITRLRNRMNQMAAGRRVRPEVSKSLEPKSVVKLLKKDKLKIPELDIRQQALEE